jgi:sugar-specific transcriptional regulator TrmB
MLDKILEDLELGPKERSIYKVILEYGKIAPHLISRLTQINRTTVYSVAKELKQKGLVVDDLGGKTIYYLPTKESDIDKVIANESRKIEEKKNSLKDLQEILKGIPGSKTYSVPKIRFITEEDLEEYLYSATKKWSESIEKYDNTIWGFQGPSLAEKYENWIDWFWENVPNHIELKLLTNESDIEKKMEAKIYKNVRKMKFFNSDEFTSSQLIHGDFVIFFMTQQKPFYAIEINDSVIAHNLRTLFKKIWETV